ncbi:hypothetical protein HPB51_015831 [Rhipicephalus microplus]|uniref:M13 family peptidase n=2 Tax=Rhipicephalus microplus TaxID=6941 RepID=A0A9J6F5F8_RHIMP|nr:hypothetical protein HPB51_015831 [Rhipicephalus microplus]
MCDHSSAVANYLSWRIVQVMGQYATERFRRARFRFDRYRYLLQDVGEIPRACVRLTSRLLHFAVGRLYFDRHISRPAERYRKLYDMAEELRDAFAVLIDLNTWMDSDTKERARQKLHHLQMNIGFPPWIKSDRDLDEVLQGLDAHVASRFENIQQLTVHAPSCCIYTQGRRSLAQLPLVGWFVRRVDVQGRGEMNSNESTNTMIDVPSTSAALSHTCVPDLRKEEFFISLLRTLKIYNRIMFARLRRFKKAEDFGWIPPYPSSMMHYSLLGNYMLLPIDYIQYPFFLLDMTPPINFGALGTIMGQQLTYGFGEQGALYDEHGKLVEWWSRETHRKFIIGARCLSEQYDQFNNPITGMKLSVNNTLETSIADNAGLRLAFKAFRVYMTKYEERYGMYSIPGMEPWTMEQVFFIAYALSRCEVSRKRSMYFYLRPRDQIPNRFRTIIPLMNFERFSAIFSCKVGTIMNPDQKCIVW